MSVWENYRDARVQPSKEPVVRPRMSMTSDIMSFRLCRRQYGYFGNDNFVPTQTTQLFYGTIIHQVLDRAHRHFGGLVPEVDSGHVPSDEDIEEYFQEVENALVTHGVRPKSGNSRAQALRVLKRFNRIEGPALYPRVFDTEYRLESSREDYILRGVVDVIAEGDVEKPGEREIWDYKGQHRPSNTSDALRDYRWQMCVYAELYKAKTGEYPSKAILYFMNELDTEPAPDSRPVRALYEVNFTDKLIQEGIDQFDVTAGDIIQHQDRQEWPAPENPPGEETCDVCDIRWNCPAVQDKYPTRYPIFG